jgi:hypothetical protein
VVVVVVLVHQEIQEVLEEMAVVVLVLVVHLNQQEVLEL